jgi:hypothetical protein
LAFAYLDAAEIASRVTPLQVGGDTVDAWTVRMTRATIAAAILERKAELDLETT